MPITSTKKPTEMQVMARGFAIGFIVVFLVAYTLHIAAPVMIPFAMAVCVWYLINAIARGLGKVPFGDYRLPRDICFLFSILSLIAGLWFSYKLISTNAADVIAAAGSYQSNLRTLAPKLLALFPAGLDIAAEDILKFLDVGGFITAFVKTFTNIAGKTLVVLFYTGFLLYEQQFFSRKIANIAGTKLMENKIHKILKNIDINIQRYIWVKTVISICTGVSTWLILRFFGIDFAEFWGMMAFILNFIPYVGSLVAIVLPSLVAFVQLDGDIVQVLIVGNSLFAIQLLFGSALDPRLLGDSLNLSPIFIILSLGAWGMLWGIPGMFLAIPILAIFVITLSQFESTRPIAILLSKTGIIEGKPKKER